MRSRNWEEKWIENKLEYYRDWICRQAKYFRDFRESKNSMYQSKAQEIFLAYVQVLILRYSRGDALATLEDDLVSALGWITLRDALVNDQEKEKELTDDEVIDRFNGREMIKEMAPEIQSQMIATWRYSLKMQASFKPFAGVDKRFYRAFIIWYTFALALRLPDGMRYLGLHSTDLIRQDMLLQCLSLESSFGNHEEELTQKVAFRIFSDYLTVFFKKGEDKAQALSSALDAWEEQDKQDAQAPGDKPFPWEREWTFEAALMALDDPDAPEPLCTHPAYPRELALGTAGNPFQSAWSMVDSGAELEQVEETLQVFTGMLQEQMELIELNPEIDILYQVRENCRITRLYNIIAGYTAGKKVKNLKPEVQLLCSIQTPAPTDPVGEGYDKSTALTRYLDRLWTLSLAILTDQDAAVMKVLLESLSCVYGKDRLFDLLYSKTAQQYQLPLPPEPPAEALLFPALCASLVSACDTGDPASLTDYLDGWYQHCQEADWYDNHTILEAYENTECYWELFFGYWALEAAAAVKIFGLKCDAIKQHPRFPLRLVESPVQRLENTLFQLAASQKQTSSILVYKNRELIQSMQELMPVDWLPQPRLPRAYIPDMATFTEELMQKSLTINEQYTAARMNPDSVDDSARIALYHDMVKLMTSQFIRGDFLIHLKDLALSALAIRSTILQDSSELYLIDLEYLAFALPIGFTDDILTHIYNALDRNGRDWYTAYLRKVTLTDIQEEPTRQQLYPEITAWIQELEDLDYSPFLTAYYDYIRKNPQISQSLQALVKSTFSEKGIVALNHWERHLAFNKKEAQK